MQPCSIPNASLQGFSRTSTLQRSNAPITPSVQDGTGSYFARRRVFTRSPSDIESSCKAEVTAATSTAISLRFRFIGDVDGVIGGVGRMGVLSALPFLWVPGVELSEGVSRP